MGSIESSEDLIKSLEKCTPRCFVYLYSTESPLLDVNFCLIRQSYRNILRA